MAISTTSTSGWDQAAYDKMTYFALRKSMYFDAVADVQPTNQSMPGTSVIFNQTADLAIATASLNESTDLTPATMSDSQVTVTLAEKGNVVGRTAKLGGTSYIPVDPVMANLIGYALCPTDGRPSVANLAHNGEPLTDHAEGNSVGSPPANLSDRLWCDPLETEAKAEAGVTRSWHQHTVSRPHTTQAVAAMNAGMAIGSGRSDTGSQLDRLRPHVEQKTPRRFERQTGSHTQSTETIECARCASTGQPISQNVKPRKMNTTRATGRSAASTPRTTTANAVQRLGVHGTRTGATLPAAGSTGELRKRDAEASLTRTKRSRGFSLLTSRCARTAATPLTPSTTSSRSVEVEVVTYSTSRRPVVHATHARTQGRSTNSLSGIQNSCNTPGICSRRWWNSPTPEETRDNRKVNAGSSIDALAADVLAAGSNVEYATGGTTTPTARNTIEPNDTLTAHDVRVALARLRAAFVAPFGSYYAAFIHPDVASLTMGHVKPSLNTWERLRSYRVVRCDDGNPREVRIESRTVQPHQDRGRVLSGLVRRGGLHLHDDRSQEPNRQGGLSVGVPSRRLDHQHDRGTSGSIRGVLRRRRSFAEQNDSRWQTRMGMAQGRSNDRGYVPQPSAVSAIQEATSRTRARVLQPAGQGGTRQGATDVGGGRTTHRNYATHGRGQRVRSTSERGAHRGGAFVLRMPAETEREGIRLQRVKRQSELHGNMQSHAEMTWPASQAVTNLLDLKEETGSASWTDPHTYSQPEEIWTGEIGAFSGFRFIETASTPMFADAGSSTTLTDVYATIFHGRQALAKAYSTTDGNGRMPKVVLSPVVDLLARFRHIGWYWLGGHARFREAAIRRVESSSSIGTNS